MQVMDRSRNMARIRRANTRPEMEVRRFLHGLGYRYRVDFAGLPGRPDLALLGRRKVVFVNGCYWHRHDCRRGQSIPSTNKDFWRDKLSGNLLRNLKDIAGLLNSGWNVFVIWECEIHDPKVLSELQRFLGPPLSIGHRMAQPEPCYRSGYKRGLSPPVTPQQKALWREVCACARQSIDSRDNP